MVVRHDPAVGGDHEAAAGALKPLFVGFRLPVRLPLERAALEEEIGARTLLDPRHFDRDHGRQHGFRQIGEAVDRGPGVAFDPPRLFGPRVVLGSRRGPTCLFRPGRFGEVQTTRNDHAEHQGAEDHQGGEKDLLLRIHRQEYLSQRREAYNRPGPPLPSGQGRQRRTLRSASPARAIRLPTPHWSGCPHNATPLRPLAATLSTGSAPFWRDGGENGCPPQPSVV